MKLDTYAAVKMLTATGASEALAVAVVGVVREAKRGLSGELPSPRQAANGEREGPAWWERWAVLVSVIVAVISLGVTSWQQTKAIDLQTVAVEQQTAVTVVSLRDRVREQLSEGGYRFELARRAGAEALVTFVRDRLLFTIEAYVEDLETLGLELGTETRVVRGTLQVLATGFCERDVGPVQSGSSFADLGFSMAGTLADELDVKTCLPEEPGDGLR